MTLPGMAISWKGSRERTAMLEGIRQATELFRSLELMVPSAQWVSWHGAHNWQFVERLPSQAIVQKLARQISTTNAMEILLGHGMLQEVGSMQRMLDEVGEDILFIALALITGDWTTNHDKYLEHFWSDDERIAGVQRKSIRAYVNRAFPEQLDPSTADAMSRKLYQVFSDFLHARSSSLIAMISGPPPRHHLAGILDAEAMRPFCDQAPTYGFRCLLSAVAAVRAIENGRLAERAYAVFVGFERRYSDLITH